MVPEQIDERKAVKGRHTHYLALYLILLVLVVAFTTCVVLMLIHNHSLKQDYTTDGNTEIITTDDDKNEPGEEETQITPIDFQDAIDDWVSTTKGSAGIVIYDLDLNKISGIFNANEKFQTASLYKLFVVYEGYRRVQDGTLSADEIVGTTRRTVLDCLDAAIRESHSPCAETIWGIIGHDELDYIASVDFSLPELTVSHLKATPMEIMEMMKIFYQHREITDEILADRMMDSFLNQPTTTYNWRQGLPSGFSDKVKVYNKVGWNYDGKRWTIYDDAAILDFINEERHFIVVVMTSGIDYRQIRSFGAQIENTFYDQYVLKN